MKPYELSKEGFIDFCSMRRYPLLALRKLCGALKRSSLPLEVESIQKLIRQTLYQVGDLHFTTSNRSKSIGTGAQVVPSQLQMKWREFDMHELSKSFTSILPGICDIQKECPYLYKAISMISEISNYVMS